MTSGNTAERLGQRVKMDHMKGYVEHIIYQSKETGYTVLNFVSDGKELTCVGNLKNIEPGETLMLEGSYTDHTLYGKQFRVETFQAVAPEDAVSMERYLGSGAIKGVGQALASRIVKKFGTDTFRIMEEEPERLSEVKGVSERMAREIGSQMEEKRELRDAMLFLQQYGISNALAVKIYQNYGMKLYHVMKENPYKLAEDISGVGFKLADEIASKTGIRTDSDFRIRSGLLYTLLQASSEGHIYLPRDILLQRAGLLLDISPDLLASQLENLMMDQKIIMKKKGEEILTYASTFYYAELNCARLLTDLNRAVYDQKLPAEEEMERKRLEKLERSLQIVLDDLQREAVLLSMKHGVFLLSGGPGTGKTTTINTMIKNFEEEGCDILLAAPTGRAAKRMTEATGYEARTIHRLLEINGAVSEDGSGSREVRFEKNAENPLETDVVIIDEMSMVDIFLFQALLKAIAPGTRLILVGDVDQLPSVGPGQILHDLIISKAFPAVVLKKIFRQAEESDIVMNAHRINHGQSISLNNKSKDFFFLERNDVQVIYKHMIQLIQDKLPGYVNAESYDIQVLTPMRKGALGAETLNRILQQYLNPPSPGKKEHKINDEECLREGDKVMQVKNNYQLEWEVLSHYQIPVDKGVGIFNGDMGIIREINEFSATLTVEFDESRRVTYPFVQIEELELAYAITVHKSQGSEYPAVIMPLLGGPRMLFNRNLLYTAITRARSCVTILGSSETVQNMIDNVNENRRYTSLHLRIAEIAEIVG